MSRNLRERRSPWIVIDETGSAEDDNFPSMDEGSDYEVQYLSSKGSARNKVKNKVLVVDPDEPDRKASTKGKSTAKDSKTSQTKTRNKGFNSKTDEREKERSSKTDDRLITGNAIVIDDEDDDYIKLEASLTATNGKRKGLKDKIPAKKAKTAEAPSSEKKSSGGIGYWVDKKGGTESKKLEDDETGDSDSVVEYGSSRKTRRKDKGEDTKDKDIGAKTSSTATEVKNKRFNSQADVKEDEISAEITLSSEDEITIDDEDDKDVQLETSIPIRSTKRRKGSPETVAVKKIEITQASSLKQKSAIHKINQDLFGVDSESDELNADVNEDCDDVVEYQSSKKAVRREKNEVPAVRTHQSTHKASIRGKDVTAKTSTAVTEARKRRFNSKADVRKEAKLSETELSLKNAIVIDDDDDDDEDIKSKTKLPAKSTKRKGSNETAAAKKAKTVKASSSKQKLEIDGEDKNLSAVEPGSNEYEKDGSNTKGDIEWSESDYLSEFNQIEPQIAGNLVSLFKEDNTIPFIARYRKEMTGGMEPEQLRSIKNTYDNIKLIKQRALLIVKTVDKLGKWSPEIHAAITSAKSIHELDLIYAPFKPGAKGSLAERAKELGLAPIGEAILHGRAIPHLSALVDIRKEGLRNEKDIEQSIMHIIADVISKDKTTFEGIHELRKTAVINISATKSKSASSSKANEDAKQKSDHHKYENYFNFVSSVKFIKDYQILAINRAESQKILTVKILIPDSFQNNLKDHCLRKYNFVRKVSDFHYLILEKSFNDAYNRLIKPLITRQVRHDLNERAATGAIEVFASNLKKLLLTPPLRGKTILGIDPGFVHGCKLGVISHCGNVLDTATIYPHTSSKANKEQQARILANLVKKHSCEIVALGNATACRETEMFLTDLIQNGAFAPLDISYTIVNEAGASVYSCSSEAKSEFPSLDPNIISAISIARRLQDPLAELIKVEPQHLGIGMYQHDLPKKQLQLTLDEVITETVSFVGVDINTASHCLLRKVAGLSATRAKNIIARRDEKGPFCNRKELLEVKGIGKKFFEQCAGFIRILPETALTGNRSPSSKYSLDYLDQTWIHPESYKIARKFLNASECDLNQLGTESFIQKVLSYANGNREMLAKQFGTSETSMDIIIKGLSMEKGEDIRVKEDGPLFQKNLRCIDDLCINMWLTGSVRNVTNFGTFVDIGVGRAGLIPVGKMKGQTLSLGQRVEVVVLSIDKDRGRIALSL